ncbi:putative FBD-associated F-box protein At1g61330 [Vicia villosa]|uniref:putative FBD-associated F-box protein At1g61330 n=1 Tax=Vicia villosa TaxID=3911 RepID=UPI00273B0C7E|nr:putative FBD-associated F-box protein At1g61330 [Vicia villosa]
MTEDVFNVFIENCIMIQTIDLIHCSRIKKLILFAKENNHFRKLTIVGCQDLEEIWIDSQTLRSIFYHGNFVVVRVEQGMQLYEAFFYFITFKNYMQATQLESLVSDLSKVSILTTTHLFIEGLIESPRDAEFRDKQYFFINLKELHLFLDGGIFCNPYHIIMFLKKCPCLIKLYIDLNDYQLDLRMYWEMHQKHLLDNCNHKFSCLKDVVLRSFKFLPSELELVKSILQRATILESLNFVPPKTMGCSLLKRQDALKYKKLFDSWRASTKAIIKLDENYVEKTLHNPTCL